MVYIAVVYCIVFMCVRRGHSVFSFSFLGLATASAYRSALLRVRSMLAQQQQLRLCSFVCVRGNTVLLSIHFFPLSSEWGFRLSPYIKCIYK